MKQTLRLYGLPGCGKNRLADAWQAQVDGELQIIEFAELASLQDANDGFNLLVVDARSFLQQPRDAWLLEILQSLLATADAVVLNFLEAASLEQQMAWQRFLREQSDVPLLLSLQHAVPDSLSGLLAEHATSEPPVIAQIADLQTLEFEFERVNLEHLMMVLDNAKLALGAKLLRAKAVLNTVEYENLVALEGTPYRWDCYPANAIETAQWQNRLQIQGFDLNQEWLEQMLQACSV